MHRSPDPDEAAAIAAAIDRFVAETSPGPTEPVAGSPWQRAALIEGVSAKGSLLDDPRGGTQWLS